MTYQYIYSKTDSMSVLSRFRVGIYAMANKVTSPDKDIIKYHTKDGNNILGTGIIFGIPIEFKLSERRVLYFGVFSSQQYGKTQIIQEILTPFENNPPPGYYYYLTVNESHFHFAAAFKYRFLKTKHKFSPYILVGYRVARVYKYESTISNTAGYIPNSSLEDETIVTHTWKKANINGVILTAGVNYNFNKVDIYIEPLYGKTGKYLGFINDYGLTTFNYWGLGLGLNYKL